MSESTFSQLLTTIIDLKLEYATLGVHPMPPADRERREVEIKEQLDTATANLEPQLKLLISRYARRSGI
jgi:hypothetical protein